MGIGDLAFLIEYLEKIWKWLKSLWLTKIRRIWTKKRLMKLSDEKYEIEKDKINRDIPDKEANLKEKAGLKGLRWSSPLARDLMELYLAGAKEKIALRLRLDKEIIFLGMKIRSSKDITFLMSRLKTAAEIETQTLKQRIVAIYKDCHANGFLDSGLHKIDQEQDAFLKEMRTNLLIEKETAKKE